MQPGFMEAILMLSVMLLHLIITPFTKVEESFNLQAMHDLLYKPWTNVSSFDHMDFPGVVPRTFVGPLIISLISAIPKLFSPLSPFVMLHIVRAVLGSMVVLSLAQVRAALSKRFSEVTGTSFTAIVVTQFHLMFYASRTLPNVFALIFTNTALADQLGPSTQKRYRAIVLLSVACALFRSELCIYLFMTMVVNLIMRRITLLRTISIGLCAAVLAASVSIVIDSYFWQRASYPELEVFYFNVVLNKSSAWGTEPFLWYFYNALPRALGGSYLFAMFTLLSRPKEVGVVMLPALLFVSVYSVLPHKELRFVFYALPVFNAVAAVGIERGYRTMRFKLGLRDYKKTDERSKRAWKIRDILFVLAFAGFVGVTFAGSIVQTVISSAASRQNYPSAVALRQLHYLENERYAKTLCANGERREGYIHIDVDSAMNGISQFVQHGATDESSCWTWRYSKREDMEDFSTREYTHLIWNKAEVDGFCVVHVERKFNGVDWRRGRIKSIAHTYVHRDRNVSAVGCL
ncbi:Dol-P-Man:Man(7)GlcNAc(2)-PP-Dol alpha-1,6-mannosyltransferase [Gracilariopsis chorda]|uniref:Mannosyltransferase n=1 Tax=Gracilariopsis chorda TaxID=448386 RepID=A0A2V3ISM7_9FLOR|nr:Dol-P-Man:Man(7)GlcNAc(2)-PP-Dol alpha-1,6-mannosyltransferase [Gracilariopsis chorda]|eukprot:PXF45128.1 Dol-P-Man:Man(7)GlcNAc(2)-PP-Dol alpha-1,6-mannosyltransferase [Gracilariopsis chorda]